MARLAAETDMHLGMNLQLPLDHPVAIAEELATIDALSGGRVIFSPIEGYREEEFDAFAVLKSERAGRLEESVEVIKRLWTEDHVDFDGEFYTLQDATINPKPIQEPYPPIWVGANRDRAVERAATTGDAWLANPHDTNDVIARRLEMIDPPSGEGFHGVQPAIKGGLVAETDREAVEIYEPDLREFYGWYEDAGQHEAMGTPVAIEVEASGLDRFLIGSPETVADDIVYLHDEMGIDCLLFYMQRPGIPQDVILRSIDLVGEEVIPRVNRRIGTA